MNKSIILIGFFALILLSSYASAAATCLSRTNSATISNLSGSITQQWIPFQSGMNSTSGYSDVVFCEITNTTQYSFVQVPLNSTGALSNSSGFLARIAINGSNVITFSWGNNTDTTKSSATNVYGAGLKSYWAFEEQDNSTGVYDLMGFANGTAGGGFTRLAGNFSRAMQFDGSAHTNVSFDVNGRNYLNFTNATSMFAEFNQTSNGQYLYSQDCGTASVNTCVSIIFAAGTNTSRVSINVNGTIGQGIQSGTGIVNISTWYGVTGMINTSMNRITRNGINITSSDGGGGGGVNIGTINGDGKNAIGVVPLIAARQNDGQRWIGQLDELAIWNIGINTLQEQILNNQTSGGGVFGSDTINPSILFGARTESNSSNLSRNNIVINITAVDVNLANITIYLYNSSGLYKNVTTTSSPNYFNFTGLPDNRYFFNASAYDTSNNVNYTNTSNVLIDTTYPTIIVNSPINNSAIYFSNYSTFNISVSDTSGVDTQWYQVFGLTNNVSFNGQTQVYNPNAGAYQVYFCANDTLNNVGCSGVYTYSISYDPNPQISSPSTAGGGSSLSSYFGVQSNDTYLCQKTLDYINKYGQNDISHLQTIVDKIIIEKNYTESTVTLQNFVQNWEQSCSDLLGRTLNEKAICQQSYNFIIKNNNTYSSSNFYSFKQTNLDPIVYMSPSLALSYVTNYSKLCQIGLPLPQYLNPESTVTTLTFTQCSPITGQPIFDASLPFFHVYKGELTCGTLDVTRFVFEFSQDGDNYTLVGIKLAFILALTGIIGFVYYANRKLRRKHES